jgi:hypothetical protein
MVISRFVGDHAEVVQNVHILAHLLVAAPDGGQRQAAQEPVQHVEIMAVLLHDDVARIVLVAEPIAQFGVGRVVGFVREGVIGNPESPCVGQLADVAAPDALVRLQVLATGALLGNLPRWFSSYPPSCRRSWRCARLSRPRRWASRSRCASWIEWPLPACVDAGKRGGNEHGVDIRSRQQLFALSFVELVGILIAESHHAGARIGIHHTRIVRAAAAAADQPDGDLRVSLRTAQRLRSHNREGAAAAPDRKLPRVVSDFM